MSEWKTIPADVFCDSVRDGTHDTPKQVEKGYKLVTAKHINNGQIDLSDAYLISEQDYLKINERSKVEQWDVLMSMIGNGLGKSAVVKDNPEYAIKNLALFKLGDEIKAKWLHYYLSSKSGQGFIYNSLQGSGQPFISLSLLRKFPIPVPSDETIMGDIVTVLSRYDSLIENYQKQIKLLEEAAQRLYKEWFVDLRFPGHENTKIVDGVPEGWEKKSFGSVIEYEIGGGWGADIKTSNETIPAYVIRGTDMSSLAMGTWNNLPYRFHQESNYRVRQLEHNDIIFEVSGGSKNEGVAKTFLVQRELLDHLDNHVICASFCKLIRLKDRSSSYFIYDTLKEWRASGITTQYDKRSASSIVNYRWKDFLAQQEIIIPKESILRGYIKMSELLHSRMTKISSQICLLTEARDRLLPKLMSGEIKV